MPLKTQINDPEVSKEMVQGFFYAAELIEFFLVRLPNNGLISLQRKKGLR
jgi:hypothetical protein